jgi:hypothetical protein
MAGKRWGIWLPIGLLICSVSACANDVCSSKKTERFGNFLEVSLCLDPVETRKGDISGIRGFTLTYTNISDRDGFLVLRTVPLEDVFVTGESASSLLPRRPHVYCFPHADCHYDEFLPVLEPGDDLVRYYVFNDLFLNRVEAGVEYEVRIDAPAYLIMNGEGRIDAMGKYGAAGRHTSATFEFSGIRLFPSEAPDAD